MKTLIRIDWTCQTAIIAIIFWLLFANHADMAMTLGSNLLLWQTISAIILLVMNNGRGPRRFLFLVGMFGYLLSSVANIEIITLFLPIILAICYWLLTTCNLYPTMKYHKGKFLPHTSF